MSGGKNCRFSSKNNNLTIYKQHRIAITELEIGDVGIVFGADVMVGTRRPGKGQNMELNHKRTQFEMYTHTKNDQSCIEFIYFWMKMGAY
jgi:hypothetical protein